MYYQQHNNFSPSFSAQYDGEVNQGEVGEFENGDHRDGNDEDCNVQDGEYRGNNSDEFYAAENDDDEENMPSEAMQFEAMVAEQRLQMQRQMMRGADNMNMPQPMTEKMNKQMQNSIANSNSMGQKQQQQQSSNYGGTLMFRDDPNQIYPTTAMTTEMLSEDQIGQLTASGRIIDDQIDPSNLSLSHGEDSVIILDCSTNDENF